MLGETMRKIIIFGGFFWFKKKKKEKKKNPFQGFFQGEDGRCQGRVFVLTNQFTPAALEWGFGGRWESGLPVGTPWHAPWWGCSKCCCGRGLP